MSAICTRSAKSRTTQSIIHLHHETTYTTIHLSQGAFMQKIKAHSDFRKPFHHVLFSVLIIEIVTRTNKNTKAIGMWSRRNFVQPTLMNMLFVSLETSTCICERNTMSFRHAWFTHSARQRGGRDRQRNSETDSQTDRHIGDTDTFNPSHTTRPKQHEPCIAVHL